MLSAPQTPQRPGSAADYHLVVPLTPVEPPNPNLNLDFSKSGATPSSTLYSGTKQQQHALLQTPKNKPSKLPVLPTESPSCSNVFSLETPSKELGLPSSSLSESYSASHCRRRPSDSLQTADSTAKEVDFLEAVVGVDDSQHLDAASLEAGVYSVFQLPCALA